MAKDAMEVPRVIARALVPTQLVLDMQSGVLAVLFRLVVLLTVFHESSAAVVRTAFAIMRDFFLARHARLSLMKLLHDTMMSLAAMLALGMCLRALLRGRRCMLRVGRFFLASSGRFVLVVVLPVAHQSIPLRE